MHVLSAGNLHAAGPARLSRLGVLLSLVEHRQLLRQLTWREVQGRYRGSWLGLVWALLNPLLMLGLYTFVFSVVFQARWDIHASEGTLDFALALFAGLVAYNLFSETICSSPSLILANAMYVKRVVFPLEVLPLARFGACGVQALLSLAILLAANLCYRGMLPWTLVLLPLAVLPLALFTVGVSLFLSSLGVFIRDIGNLVNVAASALLFLSPIFYPLSRPPESVRPYMMLNPLAPMIDGFRRVVFECQPPEWTSWLVVTGFSALVAACGMAWFVRSKNAFADVL